MVVIVRFSTALLKLVTLLLLDAEHKVFNRTLCWLALLVQIAHPVDQTVFEAAASFSFPAEFGTLVEFLVVAVFETPPRHIARI